MAMDKKYDHSQIEPHMQQLWESAGTYKAENNSGTVYSIDTPPPTVSGSLHIGHIFSYTQTDIIARYQRMNGHSVFYPFGFDDNGLPTERFVEKKREITAHSMSRSDFIKVCLEETRAVEDTFEKLWRRVGLSVDWKKCYSTIDTLSRKISQQSFIELYKKGFAYRKIEPALYCTACRTSVAQAELDDSEKPSTFNTIRFETVDGQPLLIATTRPELLPSCVAIFYNPADERYQKYNGTKVRVPLFGQEITLMPDEQVLIEKGTGLVMCCTFGDKTDIAWWKKYNLPYRPSFDRDGRWLASTGELAGLRVKAAREKVLQLLQAAGLLVEQKAITHAVNVHERCKHEIEYLDLQQWFIKILPYKNELLTAADRIEWYPAFMKTRYKNWVENIGWDWCISRQRFFGIPFPVWHCSDCGQVLLARDEQLPLDPHETAYDAPCSQCNSTNIVPDTDVMDTWNTSSLTPYICKALQDGTSDGIFDKPYEPMGMRPQAHDIIRTWAFYTIIKTWMHHGTIPWKSIIISGHVLSTEKEKISKSRGNSPLDPENLLKNYPADVIRYWTASGTLGHDVAFSDTQLKIGQRLIIKLWNAFIFMSEHTQTQTASLSLDVSNSPLNSWILHRATEAYEQYQNYFAQSEYSLALDSVEKFFWHDVCDNYLELIKDQLFKPEQYTEHEVAVTRQTLYEVGMRLLQLYAPFIPHVTEALYQELYRAKESTTSLHQTRYSDYQRAVYAPESLPLVTALLAIVTQIRGLKSDHKLSLKTDIAELTIHVPENLIAHIRAQDLVIKGIARAQNVVYKTSHEVVVPSLVEHAGVWHAVVSCGA